jgi:4-amino-4-deoxy-L-arabinose transferase-like glycosyltransferase
LIGRYPEIVFLNRGAVARLWNHRSLGLMVLVLILYLARLGQPPLWEPDEGRYAEVAREMVVSGDYVTPHDNFVPYLEKPPLVYWLTAASLRVFGHNEFAVRLQAALASAGQVAITTALAEKMFGPTTGMLSGIALALSPLFFAFSRFATPDPALAFFLTAAMGCVYAGFSYADPSRGVASNWILAAAVMLALGTLTKGLVAPVLALTISLLWLLSEARLNLVTRLPWAQCIGLYLCLTLPWFVLVALRNPGFVKFFLIHEHFQRYVENTEHSWGPWFYIPITIAGTWPWFYFVPFALGPRLTFHQQANWPWERIFRSSRGPLTSPDAAPPRKGSEDSSSAALHFLLIWFCVVFIFFSIPRSKLGEYILPGLPPLAILAGDGLATIGNRSIVERRRIFLIFGAINMAAAFILAGLSFAISSGLLKQTVGGDVRTIALTLIAMGGVSVLCAPRTTPVRVIGLVIPVLLEMGTAMHARERVASLVSYRELARSINLYASEGCRLMSYKHFEQALPFYTGLREVLVNYRGELQPFGPHDAKGDVFATSAQLREAWGGHQCIVLISNRSDVPELTKLLSPKPSFIGCEGKKVALFNSPADRVPSISSACKPP